MRNKKTNKESHREEMKYSVPKRYNPAEIHLTIVRYLPYVVQIQERLTYSKGYEIWEKID